MEALIKTIIAGSRDLIDKNLLLEAIKESGFEITEVVCGGANGMDELGRQYALDNKIDLTVIHANWEGKGKLAGFSRNTRMAEYAEALICVHHETTGSQNMVRQAKEKFLHVYEKVVPTPPVSDAWSREEKRSTLVNKALSSSIVFTPKSKNTLRDYENWIMDRALEDTIKKNARWGYNFAKPKPIDDDYF